MDETLRLSKTFLAELREEAGPSTFREICRRNAKEANPGVCRSHDFLDANMTIARAFERVLDREPDVEFDADLSLWGRARGLAKDETIRLGRERERGR